MILTPNQIFRLSPAARNSHIIQLAIHEDLKLCNCAKCDREIVGESHKQAWLMHKQYALEARLPPPIAGRINERPYCRPCLNRITDEDAAA
jgi:hypothetical protein